VKVAEAHLPSFSSDVQLPACEPVSNLGLAGHALGGSFGAADDLRGKKKWSPPIVAQRIRKELAGA